MPRITIDLPADVFSALGNSPEEFAQEMRLAAAIHWYTQGVISHEKAARIAGVSRAAFIDELAWGRLPAFHVDIEELKREITRA